MKVFGHLIFEDDPELVAYLDGQQRRKEQNIARSCERKKGDPIPLALPRIPFADYIGLSKKASAKEDLRIHREFAAQGQCHYFNGKKYCYHTGREIITEEES